MILGIDPGQHGGLALLPLGEDRSEARAIRMPLIGSELNVAVIKEWIGGRRLTSAYVEEASAMPGGGSRKMGAVSAFNYGMHYGGLLMLEHAIGAPVYIVSCRAWKAHTIGAVKRPGMSHQQAREANKQAAIAYARERWPAVDLMPGRCRKPHDGLADAVCIADYGRKIEVSKIDN